MTTTELRSDQVYQRAKEMMDQEWLDAGVSQEELDHVTNDGYIRPLDGFRLCAGDCSRGLELPSTAM